MPDRYEMNSVVRLVGEFRTPKTAVPPSVLIDPALVTLRIRKPDLTVETRTYGVSGIDRDGTGMYSGSLALDQEGTYYWRWTGATGATAVGAQSGVLDSVREPNF